MGGLCGKPSSESKEFSSMDWDDSGAVSKDEVMDWIRDERFVDNPMFSKNQTLEQLVESIMALDKDADGRISEKELSDFLDSLDHEKRRLLVQTLLEFCEKLRKEALDRVFVCLDTNNDGQVDKDEVLFWLKNERSWKEVRQFMDPDEKFDPDTIITHIYEEIDSTCDDDISLEELHKFFRKWHLREIRMFTDDQRYYDALTSYAADPTEENRKAVQVIEEDRAYAKQVEEERDGKKSDE